MSVVSAFQKLYKLDRTLEASCFPHPFSNLLTDEHLPHHNSLRIDVHSTQNHFPINHRHPICGTMFAPSVVLRAAARRVTSPVARTPIIAHGFRDVAQKNFKAAIQRDVEVISAGKVPVTTYKDGERQHAEIAVENPGSEPVNPPGADVRKAAIALDPSLTKQLTPTMARFTLHGKVAVVTG